MRRVFVLTAEDVAREVPAYGNFVAVQQVGQESSDGEDTIFLGRDRRRGRFVP